MKPILFQSRLRFYAGVLMTLALTLTLALGQGCTNPSKPRDLVKQERLCFFPKETEATGTWARIEEGVGNGALPESEKFLGKKVVVGGIHYAGDRIKKGTRITVTLPKPIRQGDPLKIDSSDGMVTCVIYGVELRTLVKIPAGAVILGRVRSLNVEKKQVVVDLIRLVVTDYP